MKRPIHLSLAITFVAVTLPSAGQFLHDPAQPHTPTDRTGEHPQHPVVLPDYRGGGGIIWQEDFDGGWPAGWTTQDLSGICPWRYSLDGSYGYYNGNQNGAASGDTIASTTASNGFLICDPDSANNVNYGQPSGTTYQYLDSRFTTSAIDLTGYPNVKLEFEQYFRFNNTPTLDVQISTDGSNWTTVLDATGGVLPNTVSANADLVSVNISAVAGGQASVYVRIGWNSRVYYWMIDDMRIVVAPPNDLKLATVNYDEWFFDTADDFGKLEYTVYPTTQLRPFTFKGNISNEGYEVQSNVVLNADVTDGGGSIFSDNGTIPSIDAAAIDSIYTDNNWTPTGGVGEYEITYDLTSDSVDANPADNQLTKSYAIDPYIFARDAGTLTGRYDNGGDSYSLCNWFNMVNDGDRIYAVDVAIDDDTPAGLLIAGEIRDANRDIIATTNDYTVTTADLNAPGESKWAHLVFAGGVDVPIGDYLVCVYHFGGVDNLWTGVSGLSVPQTSLIYDEPAATWFYLTTTPMVRMNLDQTIGVAENNVTNTRNSLFPNPADRSTTLRFGLKESDQVTIEVVDASGKQVLWNQLGRIAAGEQTFQLPTNRLENGVYTCVIATSTYRSTVQLTVMH